MINEVIRLARTEIIELAPYSSARSIATNGRIFLDANESPWPPLLSEDIAPDINRYPEPQPARLIENLAKLYTTNLENIMVGRGSDESIDVIVRTFCEAGKDCILITPPTYGVYKVAAKIQGAGIREVPLQIDNNFALNTDEIINAWRENTKIVFICSPNNPTGNTFKTDEIRRICTELLGKAMVVVDEAYIEFSDGCESMTKYVKTLPNLIVLRTLSKAWSLAGARCGTAIADPQVITLLNKVRAPYPMSLPAVSVINKVLDKLLTAENKIAINERVESIKEQREILSANLKRIPQIVEVYNSNANFILVKTENSTKFVKYLRDNGIIVRDRNSEFRLSDCVRISVGSKRENKALIDCLMEWREEQ